MNFSSILTEIEKLDPEVYERTSQRRDVIKNWGRKIALASLPVALGSMFKTAYGKGTASIVDVLNYALTLEYLEAEFYNTALSTMHIFSDAARAAITTIAQHENQHVAFLKATITAANATPIAKPTFDFSGGGGSGSGPFASVFGDYNLFLAVAQVLEDTGVRAYKGAAPDLMSDNAILTAALNIHSVEARHASHIRQMRRATGAAPNIKPWITGNDSGITPANLVEANYKGEENKMQGTVNIVGIGGFVISDDAASEAFDEPLTMSDVMTIIAPFIAP